MFDKIIVIQLNVLSKAVRWFLYSSIKYIANIWSFCSLFLIFKQKNHFYWLAYYSIIIVTIIFLQLLTRFPFQGNRKKCFFFPIPFYWILKLYDDDSLLFFLNTKTIKQIVMSKIIIIYSNYVIDISFIVFLNIFVLLHITLFFGMLRQSHKNKTLHAVKYISSKQAETTNEQLSEILLAKQHQRMPKSSNKNTFHSFFVIFLFAEKSVL